MNYKEDSILDSSPSLVVELPSFSSSTKAADTVNQRKKSQKQTILKITQKNSSVITIERLLIQTFVNYQTMTEILTDKNGRPKYPTGLEKVGPTF